MFRHWVERASGRDSPVSRFAIIHFMTESRDFSVLLLTTDPARTTRLAGLFDRPEVRLERTDPNNPPAGPIEVDIVIVDGVPCDDDAETRRTISQLAPGATLLALGEGTDSRADATLPPETGEQELLTACRLLAEIARLRARLQTATQSHKILTKQALTDPLTGLPNRRAWEERLERQLALIKTTGDAFCMAVLDLDHFKQVNDVHGHPMGDTVLRATAAGLQASVRNSDFVARLGGDEFALVLGEVAPESAGNVVERIRASLPEEMRSAGLPPVTASAGSIVVEAGAGAATPLPCSALYQAADEAMHEAKRAGRDRSVASRGIK